MIRFTWRQFQGQAVVAFGALAVAVVVVIATGMRLAHIYDTTIGTCRSLTACPWPGGVVVNAFGSLGGGIAALGLALPVLLGVFWGGPLVAREFETGTYRLVWTQSVSRDRWLAAKLAVWGLASVTVAGVFGLLAGWWAGPHNAAGAGRFVPAQFDVQGLVPAGYAAFAFAAAATAGVLVRRVVPAMALGLAVFAGARLAVRQWVRQHFATPVHLNIPLITGGAPKLTPTSSGGLVIAIDPPHIQNAWIYSIRAVDNAGHTPTVHFLQGACPNLLASGYGPAVEREIRRAGGMNGCISTLAAHLHGLVTYQPAGRYWLFQTYETAIFTGLALLLVLFCFWWLRRRLT